MTGITFLLHFLFSPCKNTLSMDCFWDFDKDYPVSSYEDVHEHLYAQQEDPDVIRANGGMAFVLGSMRVHRESKWCAEESEGSSEDSEGSSKKRKKRKKGSEESKSSRVLVIVDVIRSGFYHVFCAQEISLLQARSVSKKLKRLHNLNFSFRHSDDYQATCKYKLCVFFNTDFFTLITNAYSTLSGVISHNAVKMYKSKLRCELYIDPSGVEDSPVQIIGLQNNVSEHLFYIVNMCLPHQRDYMISFNKGKDDLLGMRTMANCGNVRLLDLKNAVLYAFERSKRDRKKLKYYTGPAHYFLAGDFGVRRGMIDVSYLNHILTKGEICMLRRRDDPFNLMRDQNTLVYDHLPFKRATGENFNSGFTFMRSSLDKNTGKATSEHFCDMSDYIYYASTCKVRLVCSSVINLETFSDYYKLPLHMSFWIGSVFDVSNGDMVW